MYKYFLTKYLFIKLMLRSPEQKAWVAVCFPASTLAFKYDEEFLYSGEKCICAVPAADFIFATENLLCINLSLSGCWLKLACRQELILWWYFSLNETAFFIFRNNKLLCKIIINILPQQNISLHGYNSSNSQYNEPEGIAADCMLVVQYCVIVLSINQTGYIKSY